MSELFRIMYVRGETKWVREEIVEKPAYYAILKGGEWFGEGNFCGWYSYEYYKNVEIYGILDEKYKVIEIYNVPKLLEKLEIYSIAWGGNKLATSLENIEKKEWHHD